MKNVKLVLASKAVADRITAKIKAKAQQVERGWWELGHLIDQALRMRVPKARGQNAEEWLLECVPHSFAKAWRALRIVRALTGVPEKTVAQLSEGNAYALSRLPEKKRKSAEWINRALTTSKDAFEDQVAEELETKHGIKRENFLTLHQPLPRDIFEQFEAAVTKMARILSLDIVQKPGLRIQVFEAIAALINTTDESRLIVETTGDEEAVAPGADPLGRSSAGLGA